MNDYIIIILLVILIILFFFKNKKNDNQGSYDPLKHEGYNKDIKDDIKGDISTKIENLRTAITNSVSTVGTNVGVNKGIIESKSGEILEAHRRLVESISGSKKSGIAGELLLENFFRSSGLVENTQWVKNQSYEKDGTTLSVEFAIKHPTGLVLPVDAHWTKTLYEQLSKLREEAKNDERDRRIDEVYKEIIKSYGNKAKEVSKKYIDSPISTDFACVYVPSESLYLELNTHITTDKELWISEIQKKYKINFMGPSTFSAYCSAILLGFNSIAVDQKAKTFLKHVDALNLLIKNHFESAETHENNMKRAFKSASDIVSTSEKIKNQMEKAEESIKEIEDKNNG
jgi:DNA anti-recombination protein RmuC